MKVLGPILTAVALVAIPFAASAEKTFVAPSSWNHIVPGTPGAARSMDVWKQADSTVNLLVDSTTSFNDMIGGVRKNAQDGGIKIVIDKDVPCAGTTAHQFEIEFDAGRKMLTTQTIIPDPKGVTRISYMRPADQPFSKDIKSAIDSYCNG